VVGSLAPFAPLALGAAGGDTPHPYVMPPSPGTHPPSKARRVKRKEGKQDQRAYAQHRTTGGDADRLVENGALPVTVKRALMLPSTGPQRCALPALCPLRPKAV